VSITQNILTPQVMEGHGCNANINTGDPLKLGSPNHHYHGPRGVFQQHGHRAQIVIH
jgi:hypothetical protein